MKIAIAGNIASGKSAVEKILEQQGLNVYDADKIAHDILKNCEEVKNAFLTAGNDRKKLGEIVFKNPEKRKLLESILHPKIKEVIENINDEICFVSVPLLFEANFDKIFDKIIFVSAPEEIRLKRLMNRNNLTKEEAMLRIQSQACEEEKIKKSDFVIINDSTLENLETQINKIIKNLVFVR